jgi:pimeloyl-ACP methyl ester carboxylesterase
LTSVQSNGGEVGPVIEPVESRVRANGLSHHVLTWDGGGPPVLLCHGFLDLAWSWDGVARRLASRGYRVHAFDWRGHGETEWVGAGGYYHFPDYILDLTELVPALSSEPVHLVGHSMGGTACSLYAGTRPDTLRSLSLVEGIGPPAQPPSVAPDRFGAFLRTVAKVRGRETRAMADLDAVVRRMKVQNPDLPEGLGRFLAEKGTKPAPDGEGRVFTFDPLHQTTSPAAFHLEAYLAFLERIEVPTLVVGAERGYRVEDEEIRRSHIPSQQPVELPAVGHMVHWHAPERLAEVLQTHFEAVP